MMKLTSQRGVSLMLLIIMITVFAALAIGTVTLLRARHETYPYQVQSYQAAALADAGVQFATRYALDNGIEFTSNPGKYILPPSDPNPTKNTYSLGNGQFQLRYQQATTCTPGQMGTLYCKGTVGTATREVQITDFGGMIGKISGNALLVNPDLPWQDKLVNDWGGPWPGLTFNGWRVSLKVCGTSQYGQGNIWMPVSLPDSPVLNAPVLIAISYPDHWPNGLPTDPPHPCRKCPPQGSPGNGWAPDCTGICASPTGTAQPLKLARLIVSSHVSFGGYHRFAWDEICDRGTMGTPTKEITMPHWDGVTIPPPEYLLTDPRNQSYRPVWNVKDPYQYPYGSRTYQMFNYSTGGTYTYCYGGASIQVGQFWNSDSYPISLDFVDPMYTNEPPVGPTYIKYYIEFPTIVMDPVTYVRTTYTNRYAFRVDHKNY